MWLIHANVLIDLIIWYGCYRQFLYKTRDFICSKLINTQIHIYKPPGFSCGYLWVREIISGFNHLINSNKWTKWANNTHILLCNVALNYALLGNDFGNYYIPGSGWVLQIFVESMTERIYTIKDFKLQMRRVREIAS